jgi:hypothetical protein
MAARLLGYPGLVAGGTRALALLIAAVAAAFAAATALAAAGDPKVAIKSADQARAKAILLKKAELPGKGWTSVPFDFGRANPLCLTKKYSLAKLTVSAQVGTEFSRSVDVGTFLVDSEARTYVAPQQARQAIAIRSALGVGRCVAAALAAGAPNGAVTATKVKPFSIDGLALPSKGFLITVTVIVGGQKSTVTAVVLAFRHNRTTSELSALSSGHGWSKDKFRSVAALMAKRTAAVK